MNGWFGAAILVVLAVAETVLLLCAFRLADRDRRG